MVDVVIAGGGIAGSSLAILLGRSGLAVELFEREHFPREKPCGEGLMPGGVAVLQRMGLAEAVGGSPFYGVRYHFGDRTAEGRFAESAAFPAAGRGQRRKHLDQILFCEAAKTPGVNAYTGTQVDAPLIENGRVTGLKVAGEPRRAKLVVGADGVHSRVRRLLQLEAPPRRRRLGIRAHFRLRPDAEQPAWVDVFVAKGHELYVTPLPEREILVAALAYPESLRGPVAGTFERWCQDEPALARRLEGAEPVTRPMCSFPLAGGARRGGVPGAVLLGDAAGFLDPITGGGMTQALQTSELLATYLRHGVDSTDAWLEAFERERQSLLRDYILLTRSVLWLSEHPSLARLAISAMGRSSSLLSHLVGVSGGTRPLINLPRGLFGALAQVQRTRS
jgi:flavin-dependent dehydrogenase